MPYKIEAKVKKRWHLILDKLSDKKHADEWIMFLQVNQPDQEFRLCEYNESGIR